MVKYEASKGKRINYGFIGVQLDYDQPMYWCDEKNNKWTLTPDYRNYISNTFSKCRTVKAFKRRLYEWSKYIPKGIRFRLISRWVGYDVIGTTKSE